MYVFQENDTGKERGPIPDKDSKGARVDAKKGKLFNKYLTS